MAAELNGGSQHIFNTDFFDVAMGGPEIVLLNHGGTATATATVNAANIGLHFICARGSNTYVVGEHEIRIRFDNLLGHSSVLIGIMGVNMIRWILPVRGGVDGCLSGDEYHLHIDMQNFTFNTHNVRTGWSCTVHNGAGPLRLLVGVQTMHASVSILPS